MMAEASNTPWRIDAPSEIVEASKGSKGLFVDSARQAHNELNVPEGIKDFVGPIVSFSAERAPVASQTIIAARGAEAIRLIDEALEGN